LKCNKVFFNASNDDLSLHWQVIEHQSWLMDQNLMNLGRVNLRVIGRILRKK